MDYYDGVAGKELADSFYGGFLSLARRAAESPEFFSLGEKRLRCANLPRFLDNFLFRVRDECVRILVLRHHARHPSYGESRV